MTSNKDRWNNCLSRLGVVGDTDIGTLCMKLRLVFVDEILGEHRQTYECFVANDVHYLEEASKFLHDGFFASSLGDLMPLAMATRLQSSLLIITTALGSQPIYVTPKDGAMEGTIILVYEPIGSGHYNAALPYCDTLSQVSMSSNVSKCVSCRCGVNKKNIGKVCSHAWCTLCLKV